MPRDDFEDADAVEGGEFSDTVGHAICCIRLAAGYVVLSGFAAPTYEDAGKLQVAGTIPLQHSVPY
ncbi:hypothetical protein NN6n1_27810 [Shinella zoogloeoides]